MQKTMTMHKLLALIALLGMLSLPAQASTTLPKGIIAMDGRPAGPMVLNDIDGNAFNLNDSRGKWVFLHFWASWCGPCIKEMPTIQAITSDFENTDLQIVLVNTAEDEDTIFSFMATIAPDLNTLMDPQGLTTEDWQPRGLPSTYFVDPEGKLRYLALGGRPWNEGEYLAFLKGLLR